MLRDKQLARFFSKLSKEGDCWIWQGGTTGKGYGRYLKQVVHRWSYSTFVGVIPDGHVIDHLCRITMCCNPDHLEAVTPSENVKREWAARPRKTHCPQGHEYTEDNLVPGRTACRECNRAWHRRWIKEQIDTA